MEIATDPELNLVAELIELKEKNKVLQGKAKTLEDTKNKLDELTAKYLKLEKDFMHLNAKSAKRFAQFKEMEDYYKRLEKNFARSGRIKR
jgi:seryl-tRNA synthetase